MRDNAQVYGNASVCGSAQVWGNARVCGSDRVTGTIFLLLEVSEFPITGSFKDKYIRVGCKSHSFLEWKKILDANTYIGECKFPKSYNYIKTLLITIMAGK